MAENNLNDLFLHTLKDIYYAENQIVKTLPKMAKAATAPKLRKAFETHLAQTQGHIDRLDQVFHILEKKPQSVVCEAIKGILLEGKEVMDEFGGSPTLDAGMVAAAQAVEHYEMARYGALKCWAEELGMKKIAGLLGQTLDEEKETDKLLTTLAEDKINREAIAAA
jgi:ferritin-like metal-binding protein YciE